MSAPSGSLRYIGQRYVDCPACQGTGQVTEQEYDEIVAALDAAEDEPG